jgi:hypothetical protein
MMSSCLKVSSLALTLCLFNQAFSQDFRIPPGENAGPGELSIETPPPPTATVEWREGLVYMSVDHLPPGTLLILKRDIVIPKDKGGVTLRLNAKGRDTGKELYRGQPLPVWHYESWVGFGLPQKPAAPDTFRIPEHVDPNPEIRFPAGTEFRLVAQDQAPLDHMGWGVQIERVNSTPLRLNLTAHARVSLYEPRDSGSTSGMFPPNEPKYEHQQIYRDFSPAIWDLNPVFKIWIPTTKRK